MPREISKAATSESAQKALFLMFAAFNVSGNAVERKARHDAYWSVLKGVSPRAVIAACRDAMEGKICDGIYCPSSAQLYQRALEHLPKPEPGKLEALPERLMPADEQQRVKQGWVQLGEALRAMKND